MRYEKVKKNYTIKRNKSNLHFISYWSSTYSKLTNVDLKSPKLAVNEDFVSFNVKYKSTFVFWDAIIVHKDPNYYLTWIIEMICSSWSHWLISIIFLFKKLHIKLHIKWLIIGDMNSNLTLK